MLSKEEKKQLKEKRKQEKKQKKMIRRNRLRWLKNFLWWWFGTVCGVFLFIASIVAGVLFIPINGLTGGKNEGIVSDELAGSTIGEVIFNLNQYGFDDLPILVDAVRGIAEGKASAYIEIDYDKLEKVKFGSSNIAEELNACINITATIESTVGVEQLKDFSKLSVLTEWEVVEETVDPSAQGFKPKLYYYVATNAPYSAQQVKYMRAFDDKGVRIAPADATLYYAALAKVPILDVIEIIDESLGRLQLTELISDFGGANLTEDSLLTKLLGDKTINQAGEITAESIKLSMLLGEDDTTEVAKLLSSITETAYADISLETLTNMGELPFENVKLSTFISAEEAGKFGEILESIVADTTYDDLILGDLMGEDGLQFENASLSIILGDDVSEDTQSLLEMVTDEEYANITIGTLMELEFDLTTFYLKDILDENTSQETKELIENIVPGDKTFDQITVSDLTELSLDDIDLSAFYLKDVLGENTAQDTKDLIETIVPGDKTFDQITVADLTEIEIKYSDMLLADVVGDSMNADTKKLLTTLLEEQDFGAITIGDLTSKDLSFNEVLLVDVVGASMNSNTKTLLEKVLGIDYELIKIGDFSKGLNFEDVLLSDVFGDDVAQNTIDLLEQVTNLDYEIITVGSLLNITFKVEDVKIGDYLSAEGDMAHILEDATGLDFEEITFGALQDATFQIGNIHLSSVLDSSNIGDLKAIFDDIYHADDAENGKQFKDLILSDLNVLEFDNVHIATILPDGEDNHALVEILEDEFNKEYSEIVLGDLNNFNIGALHLYKVFPTDKIDANLKNILLEISGKTDYQEVLITDLYAQANVNVLDKISLSTVLGDNVTNPMLKGLVEKGTTIGGLVDDIDDLKICQAYGENVFKKITPSSPAPAGALRFSYSANTYTQNENGDYYLSKDAGIWLLLGYTAKDVNVETGRPAAYVEGSMTLGDLQTRGSVVGNIFENATIRQLVDAGLLSDSTNQLLYPFTLSAALGKINLG